ncbi:MAG: glycoside hydrolase family 3 N-terminal domain-containing protein [Pseudomonadota bacterium]
MTMSSGWKWLGAAALMLAALALATAAANLYDPFLLRLRPVLPAAVVVISVVTLAGLGWKGRRHFGRVAAIVLLAAWCVPLSAVTAVQAAFQAHRRAVLVADGPAAAALGRHFVVGYTRLDDMVPLARKGLIGGIYVTRHNIRGRRAEDLAGDIARLQAIRRSAGLPPLVVVADQEGGIVSHLSPQLTAVPALATLAGLPATERAAKAQAIGETQGRELARLGVTINLAPVVDLRRDRGWNPFDRNSLIARRAISSDPAVVADIAAGYVRGLAAHHVGATVKHFPGLGRVRGDTHIVRASLSAPLAELEATDWQPFRALLATTPAHLMVGHVAIAAVDPGVPASLSKPVIDGVIRGRWGFQGVIVSDDMVMSAVYRHGGCDVAVKSLNAGVDLLLIAYDGVQYYRMFDCALAAQARGALDPAMMERSRVRLDKLQ